MSDLQKMIDEDVLTAVLQTVFQAQASLLEWQMSSAHSGYNHSLTGGIYRLSGKAKVDHETQNWSLILKVVLAPDPPDTVSDPDYWKREFHAYQSNLLAQMLGPLHAPKCYLAQEISETRYYLWLEELTDDLGNDWPLTHYQTVGQHLGQFNGAYLLQNSLPSEPWLSRGWLSNWLSQYVDVADLIGKDETWQHPLVNGRFPSNTRKRLLKVWDNRNKLQQSLQTLPQTLLHQDAYRPNLMAQGDRTILLDWDKMGIGAAGEELGGVVPASMIWFRVDADEAIAFGELIYQGYLAGLREAGWQGEERLVRLGFTASSVLRWLMPGLFWLRGTVDPEYVDQWTAWWQRPLPVMLTQWVKVTIYLLNLADEALKLANEGV
ncbi:MAG: phosphotransferase [Chloroflexota bacterium]